MQNYQSFLQHILDNGTEKSDRTGTGTKSVFGYQMRYDLSKVFPLVTTKKVHLKSIIYELLWFLKGDTNTKYLNDNGVSIWDSWKRPWTHDRGLVFVQKRLKEYDSYSGDYSVRGLNSTKDSVERKLSHSWVKMMKRCYCQNSHNYKYYGGRGISVSKEWHNVKQFISDVKHLPHWEYKLEFWNDFELDKDYWGSNQYSKDTCIWQHKKENVFTHAILAEHEDGTEEWFMGYTDLSVKLNLSRSSVHRIVHNGNPISYKQGNKKAKGIRFTAYPDGDNLLRRELITKGDLGNIYGKQWVSWKGLNNNVHNQISDIIHSLKHNPHSRRMIVSAWNVGEIHKMALPPCHLLFQFYVADGKLSCQLYQRSADAFLGVPFNIASYALLTMMIAQVTNLELGEFVHTFGDAHIYNNHIEQVRLQLTREPLTLPTMKLNPEVKNILDFKYEDFTLENYLSHPSIKAPVAI